MDEPALRSACRRMLRSLDVRPPLEMPQLCALIARARGRPIELVEFPLTDELALSWDAGTFDVIAWRPHTSPWHRDHSIAHELGHLLCGHLDPDETTEPGVDPGAGVEEVLARLWAEGVPPGGVRRACYASPQEATVEWIATTFLQWACMPGRAPSVAPDGPGLARVLAWRRGWL